MASPLLVRTVESTGSTNADLRAALTGPLGALDLGSARMWPHLSALRALTQTAGRGRGGRRWETPAAGALTVSVVLRPRVPVERLGWAPLLGGLAARDALAGLLDEAGTGWWVRTKWPNDVVAVPAPGSAAGSTTDAAPTHHGAPGTGAADAAGVAGEAPRDRANSALPGEREDEVPGWGRSRKLVGVLSELVVPSPPPVPGAVPEARCLAPAVVLGVGVNVAQEAHELPVPWASSLARLGARTTPEEVLALLGERLAALVTRWEDLEGDPDAGDGTLGARLRAECATLGQEVRVLTPSGPLEGRAVDLRPGLVLEVAGASAPRRVTVTAGDVTSLRLA